LHLRGVSPDHFRGVHVAHLPRRSTTVFTIE
jgi:hypothetical protein